MSSEVDDNPLSYREQDVDETLDDHGRRIKRLEKTALIAAGYALHDGANIFQFVTGMI